MKTFNFRTVLSLLFSLSFIYASSQTITTVAGNGTAAFGGDGGQATAANLNNPWDVCFDQSGNLYIADHLNHRIRKVTPGGIISTFAGTGNPGYSGDGGQATSAQLNRPWWIHFDNATGSLYFSEEKNFVIRKVNAQGIISTVAGTGVVANYGRPVGGQASSLPINTPGGVVVGPDKKLYFGEWLGSNSHILVVDTMGIISIFAGNDDSQNPSITIKTIVQNPNELMFDAAGNLFICEEGNYKIMKINTLGTATVFAGDGQAGMTGNGGQANLAQIYIPDGICHDATGTIYFSSEAVTIRSINPSGIINAYAGIPGGNASLGDGGPAIQASILAQGITLDQNGDMFIADSYHNRIRKIGMNSSNVGINVSTENVNAFQPYPNPASSFLKFKSTGMDGKTMAIEITDIVGKQVSYSTTNDLSAMQVNIDGLKSGLYYATISGENIKITEKFIKE